MLNALEIWGVVKSQKKEKLRCSCDVVKSLVVVEGTAVMDTNWGRERSEEEADDGEGLVGRKFGRQVCPVLVQ